MDGEFNCMFFNFSPGRFGSGHFMDSAAQTPDICLSIPDVPWSHKVFLSKLMSLQYIIMSSVINFLYSMFRMAYIRVGGIH